MKKPPLKRTTLLLSAALVAVAAVALTAASPEPPGASPDAAASSGTLLIPENTRLIDAEFFTMGAFGSANWYVVLVEDTTNGRRYVLHYDRPFRREARPAWVFEERGVPMEELTR